ncbi:ciliary neurotrophic factor receptor subunit alpha [Misgurnus anguillicaudatus]|uniref:ciliary neurotrophic factor receptor subunit alpha n=1 Tax=Misgurnus anguillicaudatus TaxID=75329 RepID=UPI002434BCF2|nr:ciliary neurotrophic factor receptor subunit alpha isoform X2 [Misgurnus anguillicaudatus]
MANIVTSFCCLVLAAVVVGYAQRRSQQGARIQYERIGSDVTMQCGSLDNDASVTWKVNGTDVKARRREDGPRLILLEVDMSSNGLYSCFQNPDGQRRDVINLRVGRARIQYERIGSDVTMQCGSLDNDASVTWKVNGTDVKANRREEGPRLILMQVDMSSNGLYSCFQNPDGQRRDLINLRVGVPPKEPQVTCRSNTYPKGFYCSWHLQHPPNIPTDYEVDVQHNQKPLEVKRDEDHKNRFHVKFPELFSSFPYRVNVTAVNALGRASTAISFEESSIVKPDPPEKVVAKPVPNNARRLEVTWSSPSSWPDVETFPLKYFLRYRPLIRDQWQHVELSDSNSHTITDAYAGKEYIIQLAAKDMEIGTWSDWSVAVYATPWMEELKPITSTIDSDIIPTTTTPSPPSAAPRVGEPTAACSTLLWSTHLLLACVLLSIM